MTLLDFCRLKFIPVFYYLEFSCLKIMAGYGFATFDRHFFMRLFPKTHHTDLFLSFLFMAILPSAFAGNISVGPTVNVTADQFAENETSLGMSPDGQWLASAWNDWNYNDGCGFSYSVNGGKTWAARTFVPGMTAFSNDPNIPGTGRFTASGDPAVVFNPKSGLFDVICQAFGGATGHQIQLLSTTFNPLKANPSLNENLSYGATAWTTPVAVAVGVGNGNQKGSNGQFPDHEAVTVDTGRGPGHHFGRLFIAWAEFDGSGRAPIDLSYSDDDGQTWVGPIRVSDSQHHFDQDAHPIVGPDGTVYVSFVNSKTESDLTHNLAMMAASRDGGNTWSSSYTVAQLGLIVAGSLPNSNYRVFSDVTSAIDQVSGRLVVAFNDNRNGVSTIYITRQTTPGILTSWSTPVPVKASRGEQFFPWMSSAPNGRIDLVYYDRSCDPFDKKNCVTLSSTTDGGATWLSVNVAEPFDGDLFQACLAYVEPQNCGNFFLGDYIAVSSSNGKAQILYTGNGAVSMDEFSVTVNFK